MDFKPKLIRRIYNKRRGGVTWTIGELKEYLVRFLFSRAILSFVLYVVI